MESIIVYRSPLEKAFWEGAWVIPAFWVFVMAFVLFWIIYGILSMIRKRRSEIVGDALVWSIGLACVISIVRFIFS